MLSLSLASCSPRWSEPRGGGGRRNSLRSLRLCRGPGAPPLSATVGRTAAWRCGAGAVAACAQAIGTVAFLFTETARMLRELWCALRPVPPRRPLPEVFVDGLNSNPNHIIFIFSRTLIIADQPRTVFACLPFWMVPPRVPWGFFSWRRSRKEFLACFPKENSPPFVVHPQVVPPRFFGQRGGGTTGVGIVMFSACRQVCLLPLLPASSPRLRYHHAEAGQFLHHPGRGQILSFSFPKVAI